MLNELGGLLTVVAGFGAIVAAAFGAYKAFFSAIITAIGCFVTPNILGFYFPTAGNQCETAPGGAGGQNNGVGGRLGNFGGPGLGLDGNQQASLAIPATASSKVELPRIANEPVGEIHTRVTKSDSDPFQEDSLDKLDNF